MQATQELLIAPQGRLLMRAAQDADAAMHDALHEAFATSSAHGLLALAARRRETQSWPAAWLFWREFADAYLTALAHTPEANDGEDIATVAAPPALFSTFALRVPAMTGAEYAAPEIFARLWQELDTHARRTARTAGGLKPWLQGIRPALHLLGKVTFHLAENKRSPTTPFAFMATYTHRLSAQDKPVHLPLGRAL